MTDPHEPKVPIAPVKFSFAKPKVSAAPPPVPLFPTEKPDKVHDVEYVTEFDGKGRKLGEAAAKIIPKLENSWRPEKRMKNIMVESDLSVTTEDRFETETLSAGPQPNVQYGLTLAAKKSSEESAGIEINGHAYSTGQQEAGLSFPELELQKLKADINSLPDETSLDAYENVPVEEFGEALLRGMGWEKGKPIGRNCKTVVVPIEHTKRVGREGLGAVPAPKVEKVKQYIKPGETRGGKLTVGKDERYNREGNFGTRNEGDDYVYTGKSESSKDKVVEDRDESRANRKDHMSSEGHQRERYSYISGMSDKDVERSEVSKRRTDDRTRKYDDERCVKGDKSRTKRGKDDDVYSSKSKSRKDNRRENDAVESRDVSRSKWKDDTGSKGSRRDTDKDSKTRHHRQSDDRSGNHESKARSRRKEDDCTYSGKSKSSKDNRGRVVTSLLEHGVEKSEYVECYDDYLEGHIPGAVFFNWLKDGVDFTTHVPVQLLDDTEQFTMLMERKGVSTQKPVVVYDCGDGLLAPRLWWALVTHGHPCVYVLDGGWNKWLEDGQEIELFEPCSLKIYETFEPSKPKNSFVISSKELCLLLSEANDKNHGTDEEQEDLKIIDARSQEQYTGLIRRSKHGGRIPGAINIPRQLFLEPSGRFKSIEEQRKVFIDAGLDPNQPMNLVAYCNGGVASCTVLLAWVRIGGRGRWANYDGSWNEWGSCDDLPI